MRKGVAAAIGAVMIVSVTPAVPQTQAGTAYGALELLGPCQLADSDSRGLGVVSEIECEQYILGFVNALQAVDMTGPGTGICLPELNTADEIRWKFTRWVHGDYSNRKGMSAAEALLATLREDFACP